MSIPSRRWLLAALFLAALVLRLAYAMDLPPTEDEFRHSLIAKSLSLDPADLHLPVGSRETNHPLLSVYLFALGLWAGGGSFFAARAVFILLSLAGLAGVYALAARLFGPRAGLIALFLAVCDRHLLFASTALLEPSYLFAVPWILLLFFDAVETGRPRTWALLGALGGVAYLFYALAELLALPMAAYLLTDRGRARALLSRGPWLALLAFLLAISPYLLWEHAHQGTGLFRQAEIGSSLGLTPRAFFLFLGDILICPLDTAYVWFTQGWKVCMPIYVTCHPLAGLLYLAAGAGALFHLRDRRYAYLFLCMALVMLQASAVGRQEPYNNFWWASASLVPAMGLAAAFADRMLGRRRLRPAVILAGAALAVATVSFVMGPKYGTALCPEKRLMGRHAHWITRTDGAGNNPPLKREILSFLAAHPGSPFGWFLLATASPDKREALDAARRALDLHPDYPPVRFWAAGLSLDKGDYARAALDLEDLLEEGEDHPMVRALLARIRLAQGRYPEALHQAREVLKEKPDEFPMHELMFQALAGLGERDDAGRALDAWVGEVFEQPWLGYAWTGEDLAKQGKADWATWCWARARALNPDLLAQPPWENGSPSPPLPPRIPGLPGGLP